MLSIPNQNALYGYFLGFENLAIN